MTSHNEPRMKALKIDSAVTQYYFVKFGTDSEHVALAGANERAIAIAAEAGTTAEDQIDVYLPGGGGLLKVNETVALGKLLTSTAGGLGEVADAAGEWVGAIAWKAGVQNDVIPVEVIQMQAQASDA